MKTLPAAIVALMLIAFGLPSSAYPPQPFMDAAITHLYQARADLERAARNKGGHRVQAIALIDRAIEQVREGKETANQQESF